jgi:hypothetical protein
MTRQVDFDKPLSDEDRAYLHARGQHARVEQIDADFPPGVDEGSAEPRPDWESMTKEQLLTEVDRVNTEYAVDPPLSKDGTKADVLARLIDWWEKD